MANDTPESLIFDRLAAAQTFHPAGAKLFVPDWTLEPGDVVTVTSGEESYSLPIYSMDLQWNGTSMLEVQSTGNQKREPLSALRRKEYNSGRRGYGQFKEVEEEFKEFETWKVETDETLETHAGQFVEIEGEVEDVTERLEIAETTIGQTASDAYITAVASGILLDEDGHPVLDEHGHYQYDPNADDTTLIAKFNTNATAITQEVSRAQGEETTLSGLISTEAGKISQIVTAVGQNGEVTAGSIILAINKTKDGSATSTTIITADAINLVGYVTAETLDTRLLNADSLFTDTGYADYIKAKSFITQAGGSITGDTIYATSSLSVGSGTSGGSGTFYYRGTQFDSKNVTVGGTQVPNIQLLAHLSGNLSAVALPDAIATITVDNNPPAGKIGFKYTTVGNSTPVAVNFNIADTQTYIDGVSAAKASVGLNVLSYTDFPEGSYPSSQTIYTDTTGRTDASGEEDNIHREISVSLDVDDDFVYLKHGSDVIARIANTGGGSGSYDQGYLDGQANTDATIKSISHPSGDISYLASYLNVDIFADPYLVLTDQEGIITNVPKTGMTDTVQMPVDVTSATLNRGVISLANTYSGSYTITGNSGNVNIDGQNGADIPVGVESLLLSLELGVPSTDLGTTGATKWSSENHNYVYNVSSSLGVDGTGNVLTRTSENITLVPTDAIEYGQSTVSAVLSGTILPSGKTATPLGNGTYGLYLTKSGTADDTPIEYYSVSSGSGVTYVVSSSGKIINVYNGLNVVGSLYPNTDVTLGSGTDPLGRRQISYNGRTGYVNTNALANTKGSSNYVGRIGWTDEGSDPSTRSVYSLSNVVLGQYDTGESTHMVDVTYDDGEFVSGGAQIVIDASAVSGGGGGGGQGGVRNTSKYAESGESSDWSDWSASFNGTQSLTEKYAYIKINANDDSVYNLGINASDVWTDGYTLGRSEASPYDIEDLKTVSYSSNGTRTITPSSGKDAMRSVKVTVNVSSTGGVQGVSKYAESNYASDWNDWIFNSTQSITSKYGNFTISANDGSTYQFGVNASGLVESNRTVTYTSNGTKTLYPSSKVGMEKATITINVPQSSATLGSKTFTSNGSYSASTYSLDGFSSVTVNVPSTLPTITVGALKSGSAPHANKFVTVNKGTTNYVVITAGAGNTYQLEIRANS